mmetsp:Transcript_17571/g.33355  ORF Transcript_17571/g.33355 Transcript_17571/m.33355 type:complete len:91 (-) Transcript_17571:116-388(-)
MLGIENGMMMQTILHLVTMSMMTMVSVSKRRWIIEFVVGVWLCDVSTSCTLSCGIYDVAAACTAEPIRSQGGTRDDATTARAAQCNGCVE